MREKHSDYRRVGDRLKHHSRACRTLFCHHPLRVRLDEKMQRLVEDFSVLEDPHERLSAVVDRSKRRPALPPSDRVDSYRVQGCVSVVWLVGELRDGRCYFRCDAESPLVRGLVVFLCDFFSGAPVAEVAGRSLDPLAALDLTRNLSPTRRNGLDAVRQAMRRFALAAPA